MKNRKPGGAIFVTEDSSDSEEVHVPNRGHRSSFTTTEASTSMSKMSLSSSISRFRDDFDELKCKMRIFGESLNLCHCIANDFQNRMSFMERRLQRLEDRHRLNTRESNYSAIIQKNQRLSNKTRQDAKVSAPSQALLQALRQGKELLAQVDIKVPTSVFDDNSRGIKYRFERRRRRQEGVRKAEVTE